MRTATVYFVNIPVLPPLPATKIWDSNPAPSTEVAVPDFVLHLRMFSNKGRKKIGWNLFGCILFSYFILSYLGDYYFNNYSSLIVTAIVIGVLCSSLLGYWRKKNNIIITSYQGANIVRAIRFSFAVLVLIIYFDLKAVVPTDCNEFAIPIDNYHFYRTRHFSRHKKHDVLVIRYYYNGEFNDFEVYNINDQNLFESINNNTVYFKIGVKKSILPWMDKICSYSFQDTHEI